jgi:hypothetical protein
MRTQGLGERVVLGTDIRTHLGAGGWHGPDEQNSFEDNVVSTAERLFSCAEATARMKKLSASRNVRHTSTKLFAVWKTSREFLWSVTIQHLAPGLCQVAKLSMQREECNSKGEKHLSPSRRLNIMSQLFASAGDLRHAGTNICQLCGLSSPARQDRFGVSLQHHGHNLARCCGQAVRRRDRCLPRNTCVIYTHSLS